MQWLRRLVMRWLNIPVQIEVKHFAYKGDPIQSFGVEHYEAWAMLWQTAPGLWDSWYLALGEVMGKMSDLQATDANNGERIRLCQRAVDIWQNLHIPDKARESLNAVYAAQKKQQEQAIVTNAARNVM